MSSINNNFVSEYEKIRNTYDKLQDIEISKDETAKKTTEYLRCIVDTEPKKILNLADLETQYE